MQRNEFFRYQIEQERKRDFGTSTSKERKGTTSFSKPPHFYPKATWKIHLSRSWHGFATSLVKKEKVKLLAKLLESPKSKGTSRDTQKEKERHTQSKHPIVRTRDKERDDFSWDLKWEERKLTFRISFCNNYSEGWNGSNNLGSKGNKWFYVPMASLQLNDGSKS